MLLNEPIIHPSFIVFFTFLSVLEKLIYLKNIRKNKFFINYFLFMLYNCTQRINLTDENKSQKEIEIVFLAIAIPHFQNSSLSL